MPLTILVVDDDPGIVLCVSDYLAAQGYAVVEAKDGQMALNVVEHHQPQMVITDIGMPHLNGFDLVQALRQKPSLRLLPVIFLTDHTSTSERIRGYQVGCDAYLPKPFELDELVAVVRNLFERSQLIQAAWQYTYQERVLAEPDEADPQKAAKPLQTKPLIPLFTDTDFAIKFTDRESTVLQLIVDGLSNNQIGDRLFLSPRTVEKYVSTLLRKTATNNRAELVHFAMKHDLVT
jgi:DNA-binding NarL/FixJ family response regulator